MSDKAEAILTALKILLDALQEIATAETLAENFNSKYVAQKALNDYEQATRNF